MKPWDMNHTMDMDFDLLLIKNNRICKKLIFKNLNTNNIKSIKAKNRLSEIEVKMYFKKFKIH